jgi:nucleotide-binding universal stress UspA family protein
MAQEVHIKALVTSSDAVEVNSLVAHLANHGIMAVAKVEQVAQSDERMRFPHFIAEGRYDLVVMGGFSHPKWVEFIFGGTTLSTLLTSSVPVLVSH